MTFRNYPICGGLLILMFVVACGESTTNQSDETTNPASQGDENAEALVAAYEDRVDEMSLTGSPAGGSAAPLEPIQIKSIATEGSGCPAGSVATNISPDQQAFTLVFSKFQIAIEPEPKRQRVVRSCAATIDLEVPKGWQFAVVSTDQRGFADLPAGASARVTTSIGFSERRGAKKINTFFHGPYTDDFQTSKQIKLKSSKWSRCGGQTSLEVAQEAVVRVPKNQGAVLAIDSLDGEMKQTIGFIWRVCK